MKYRVYEIARRAGLSSDEVIEKLRLHGEFARSSATSVEDIVAHKLLVSLGVDLSAPEPVLATPKPSAPHTPQTIYSWQANPVAAPRDSQVLAKIASLEKLFPIAQQHSKTLKALGSQFVFAKTFRAADGKQLGLALARFSGAIESAFGLTREVMFFYTPYRDLQIRTFTRAKQELASLSRDATPDLVLFHAVDDRLAIKLEDWSRLSFTAIPLDGRLNSDPITFVKLIRDYVYARNLFYETTPVRGPQFFGRKTILQELKDDVRQQRVSGLFGLRKSGKTSILLQLAELLDPDIYIPIFVDLEVLPSPPADPTLPLIAELATRFRAELSIRKISCKELDAVEANPTIQGFKTALQKILARLDRSAVKIILMLDEIEFLTPAEQVDIAEGKFSGVAQVLGTLRSMVQSTENFTFILSGLTNDILENGRLYGRPNPLFSWAKARYIGPFERVEADELAKAVGSRMGIEIEDGALRALYEASGGHAYLYRNLASAVVGELPLETNRRVMRNSDVLHQLLAWKRSIAGNLSEILGHLSRYYPTESLLLDILMDSPSDFESLVSSEDKAVNHLISLGLIRDVDGSFVPSTLLELK